MCIHFFNDFGFFYDLNLNENKENLYGINSGIIKIKICFKIPLKSKQWIEGYAFVFFPEIILLFDYLKKVLKAWFDFNISTSTISQIINKK